MARFEQAAEFEHLPPGRAREIAIAGRSVALWRVENEVFAIPARCPHRGGPLAEGYLDGRTVICPWHGWSFDLASGEGSCGVDIERFETKIEDGVVLVRVE